MNKDELIRQLNELSNNSDRQEAHIRADKALIDYIDDEEIREAYESIKKWYA